LASFRKRLDGRVKVPAAVRKLGSFRKTPAGPPDRRALVIFAHGSRVESANEGVRQVASELAQLGSFRNVVAAFLELGEPDLAGAVACLAEIGIREVVVIPYFLTLGLHLERDLPQLIAAVAATHPDLVIRVTAPMEGHPALLQILLDRAKQYT
jgi:sirohydrochlorin cobaltochelatase